MIEKSFSQLSISTAMEIGEEDGYRKLSDIETLLFIDDVAILSSGAACGLEKFLDEEFIYMVRYERSLKDESRTTLRLNVYPKIAAEWDVLYQLRIQLGRNKNSLKVVDSYPLHLQPSSMNTSVRFKDNDICYVKMELRTIYRHFWPLPTFTEGDVQLIFEDGSSLWTYKALLAQASSFVSSHLVDLNGTELHVKKLPRNAMVELLYLLYRVPRSLCDNFEKLAQAAVGLRVDLLIYRLNEELCTKGIKKFAETCDNTMLKEKKWHEMGWKFAIEMELFGGLKQLIYAAVLSGDWDEKLAQGWQPEQFFNHYVMEEYVKPSVTVARGLKCLSQLSDPWKELDYDTPGRFKVPIMFRGKRFFVNEGIFQLHGETRFQRNQGELTARYTREMDSVCKTTAEAVSAVNALLDELHFGGRTVKSNYLQAAIIFCHNHGWKMAKEQLARRLRKPILSAQKYLDLIQFAEKFELPNTLADCIYQAERSYHHFALELSGKKFPGVTEKTRERLIDRIVAGWINGPTPILCALAQHKEYEQMEREIINGKGGPVDAGEDEPTLAEIESDYAFGTPVDFILHS